jgi:hypothetical protein
MASKLTHSERVVKALGKRPQTGEQVAKKLGFNSHRNVARALGQAVSQGQAVKTPKGYQKA